MKEARPKSFYACLGPPLDRGAALDSLEHMEEIADLIVKFSFNLHPCTPMDGSPEDQNKTNQVSALIHCFGQSLYLWAKKIPGEPDQNRHSRVI